MRYRIFKSPGAFSGEESNRAELVGTKHGRSVREVSAVLVQAVRDDLEKIAGYEGGSLTVSPPVENGYSKEAKTRFLSMEALLEAKNQRPLLIHYNVVETVE